MEDLKEALQKLLSLDSALIDQAHGMLQTLKDFEVKLSEKKRLESEENVMLEFENWMLAGHMETRIKEMCVETERKIGALKSKVKELLGSLENERENEFNECNLIKRKLVEMEENEKKSREEVGKLKMEYDRVVKEKERMKSSVLWKRIANLNRKNQRFVVEREKIQKERDELRLQIGGMKKKLQESSKVISSLRKKVGNVSSLTKKEENVQSKHLELGNKSGKAMNREAERAKEIGPVVEGTIAKTREKRRRTESSMEYSDSSFWQETVAQTNFTVAENVALRNQMDEMTLVADRAGERIKRMEEQYEELLGEKEEIENICVYHENENAELRKKVIELDIQVLKLEQACRNLENKKKELISECRRYTDPLDQVTLEREKVLKGLDEKHNVVNMRLKVSEMEKTLEKAAEELAQKMTEWQNLVKEKRQIKREMESQFGSMIEDKDMLQRDLLEAKRSLTDFSAKMDSTGGQASTLLKNTASELCQSKDENDPQLKEEEAAIAEMNVEDENEPYAAQLEAIKQALKNKETVVQDLKKKVDIMEKYVVEAQKKKSFWTRISSATTLLAAISLAYAARRR